jgi:glycosyltransferase involved in cell wall biosynthesis
MLLTYNRQEYAERTLRGLLDNVSYSGRLTLHIADDGSPEGYRERLVWFAGCWEKLVGISVSNSERRGYGGNYNLGTQFAHRDNAIVLPLEDDWELIRPLNLDGLVEPLMEGKFGCIRLGYIGWMQPLRCEFIGVSGQHFLLLDPASPELHVFSGHPRLETVEWERSVGLWPEGVAPGDTEIAVAFRPEARTGVVWPVNLIKASGDLFVHFGDEATPRVVEQVAVA